MIISLWIWIVVVIVVFFLIKNLLTRWKIIKAIYIRSTNNYFELKFRLFLQRRFVVYNWKKFSWGAVLFRRPR